MNFDLSLAQLSPSLLGHVSDNHNYFVFISEITQQFNNYCYKKSSQQLTWEEAERKCQLEGSHLVSIHSEEENSFVKNFGRNLITDGGYGFWMGGSDKEKEGTWVWSDFSPMNLLMWDPPKQPDNYGDGENCMESNPTIEGWNDMPCSWKLPFICKKSCAISSDLTNRSSSSTNKQEEGYLETTTSQSGKK